MLIKNLSLSEQEKIDFKRWLQFSLDYFYWYTDNYFETFSEKEKYKHGYLIQKYKKEFQKDIEDNKKKS